MIPNRIFDLYYGQSGTGKSRSAATMAHEIHKKTGKKVRVCVGDGSIQTYDALIDAGIVEAMEYTHRDWPFDVAQRITEGWFPADPNDPNSPLIDPVKNGAKDIGGYIFEGAAVMGAYAMSGIKGGLAWLSAHGHKIGQDTPYEIPQGDTDAKGNFVGEGPKTKFGGNPMAHYNVAQKLVTDSVQRSKMLSRYVLWTSHEQTNDPEKSQLVKELVCGPEVVGRSLTASFQRMFGNTLHFQTVAKRVKIKDEHTGRDAQDLDLDYRIWTQDHFSPDGNTMIRYKALTRGVENIRPYYDNITSYYRDVFEMSRKALDIQSTTL